MSREKAPKESIPTLKDVRKLVVFHGEKARNQLDTDIDIILANFLICYFGNWSFMNKGEVWIDKTHWNEICYLLYIAILGEMNTGKNYSAERKNLEKIAKNKTEKNFYPTVYKRRRLIGKWVIEFVDGAQVRRKLDPHFSFGGHHAVYPYIPENVIWIDNNTSNSEKSHIILHEYIEWVLMNKFKKSYDFAHNMAIVFEEEHRRKKSKAAYRGEDDFKMRHFSNKKLRRQIIVDKFILKKNWRKIILKNKGNVDLKDILQGSKKKWKKNQKRYSTLSNQKPPTKISLKSELALLKAIAPMLNNM